MKSCLQPDHAKEVSKLHNDFYLSTCLNGRFRCCGALNNWKETQTTKYSWRKYWMDLNKTSGLLFNCIASQTFFLSLPIAYLSSLCWCCVFSGENKRDNSDQKGWFSYNQNPQIFNNSQPEKKLSPAYSKMCDCFAFKHEGLHWS